LPLISIIVQTLSFTRSFPVQYILSMRKAFIAVVALMSASALYAQGKFIEKPFTEWKKNEVFKVLNDSPWARQQTYARQIQGKGSGIGGEKEIYSQYTIRFFTALPVREAYVRVSQLMNNYDQASAEEKRSIDQRFSKPLTMDTSQHIIIAAEFAGNDPEKRMGIDRQLKQMTVEELKQSVYLISDRLGRIQLTAYYPPAPDGTGCKFVFPREVDGKPVISPEDKNVTFQWYFWDTVLLTWKVKDLVYKGKLEF
jgi:hypothetical protein